MSICEHEDSGFPVNDPKILIKITLVIIFWGLTVVTAKYLTFSIDPYVLATLRVLVSASFLLPAAYLKHGWVRLPRKAWVLVAGIALLSFALHHVALAWGISRTSGTHSVLILGLLPLTTSFLARFFVNEPLNRAKIMGLVLAFGGVMLVAINKTDAGQFTILGDMSVFLAMFMYAGGSILVRKCTGVAPSLVISAYSLSIGALILLLSMPATGLEFITPELFQAGNIAALLFLGWICTGLGTIWWNEGIYKIGASTTAIFYNGVPVIGVLASVIFLEEKLLWSHIAALALILSGVSLGSGGRPALKKYGAKICRFLNTRGKA